MTKKQKRILLFRRILATAKELGGLALLVLQILKLLFEVLT